MFLFTLYLLVSLTLTSWQQFMIDDVKGYFDKTEYKNVSVTITALSILETGWYKAPVLDEFHNYFSIKEFNVKKRHPLCKKKPIYCMREYKTNEAGYKDALEYFKRLKYPTDRKGFLDRLNGIGGAKYADDKDHVQKVKDVEWMVKNKYLKGKYISVP